MEIGLVGNFIFILCVFFVGFMVGRSDGWVAAHKEVARECERLGSFYVGKKTFKCVEVQDERAKR